MAFAGGGLNRPSARDSAPGPRFFLCAVVSVVLMYFDQRDGWGERIRYALQAAAYPIQVTIGSPGRLWHAASELVQTRDSLRAENEKLHRAERELALRTMRYEALEQENARLRGLAGALPPLVTKSELTDVVNADVGRLRQRLVVDKGASAGLYRSQSVVDTAGLVGQLVRVGPWSAEVMLITDPEAAVPVEVVRSGVRSIAVGMGNAAELQMPYLPATADVKRGDVVVTSGMGGIFPAGIPVGEVVENQRDPDDLLAHVRVRPRAALDSSRQLLALWFNPASPAAPVDKKMLDTLPAPSIAAPVTEAPKVQGTPAAAARPRAATPAPKPADPAPSPAPVAPASPAAPPATPPAAEGNQ
jgi:rod shape-determining protein MreC